MRQRTLLISLFVLLLVLPVLAACNSSGLPDTATPTTTTAVQPTPTIEVINPNPTATQPDIAENPTATPPVIAEGPTATARTTGSTPAPNATVEAENNKMLVQIEKDTATLRGLKPLKDVPEAFITEDQLRENLTKDMATEYPKKEARQDASELWLLRLINDPKLDLYQLYIDLQTEQVAGYYDQKKDELFVRSDGGKLSPLSRQTLAHEFTHALQDQHFDLEKLLPEDTKDDDGSLAVRSLIEGDATVSGLLYAQKYMSQKDYQDMIDESSNASTTLLDQAPPYISQNLYFPYQQGVEFVIAVGVLNSFKTMDKALQDPPASTEQIIHPEKYTKTPRDMPKPVALPPLTDTLGIGWTMPDNGTLGEFDFQIMLKENGASEPDVAAAGWGGAVYNYYEQGENGDKSLVLFNTVWDTKLDAEQFEAAMNETFATYTKDGNLLSDGTRFFAMKRVGDAIAVGASNDKDALTKAMAQIK